MELKPVHGFKGKYSVSSCGKLYSHVSKRVLKARVGQDGYNKVILTVSRKIQLTRRLARLVAAAWVPNPLNLPVVNHLDGNKTNDSADNLEWTTPKGNTVHAWATGLCKPYDRTKDYNRQGIIDSNKRRSKKSGL